MRLAAWKKEKTSEAPRSHLDQLRHLRADFSQHLNCLQAVHCASNSQFYEVGIDDVIVFQSFLLL